MASISPDLSVPTSTILPVPERPKLHITYLDGIRGLAALYVVIHHCYAECIRDMIHPGMGEVADVLTNWLQFGHVSVSIFIVLSGYCLMLPLSRPNSEFNIGRFIYRRAKRILPPYYAALAFSIVFSYFISSVQFQPNELWNIAEPALTTGSIVSHLFLAQDFKDSWMYKINPAMWSVAVEWQIYFVFALAMVPIWKRFGIYAVLIFALFGGIVLDRFHVANTCSHYMFLFALGAFGALVQHSPATSLYDRWKNFPWIVTALVSAAAFIVFSRGNGVWLIHHATEGDMLIGIGALSLIMICDTWLANRNGKGTPWLLQILQSKFAVWLGLFSYSLYLVHAPIVFLVHLAILQLHLSFVLTLLLVTAIGVSLSLGLCYLFFLVFEKPFLNAKAPERRIIA